jgi:hypothetical protein
MKRFKVQAVEKQDLGHPEYGLTQSVNATTSARPKGWLRRLHPPRQSNNDNNKQKTGKPDVSRLTDTC